MTMRTRHIEPSSDLTRRSTAHVPAGVTPVGEHAIVIGASVAGLLGARVLSDFFEHVTVLERDTLPEALIDRRAVPQGRHAHALHFAGQEALERLLPGYHSEAVAAGAPPCADAGVLRFRVGGHPLCKVDIGAEAVFSSRPLLEGLIRRRINALGNVTIRDRCGVLDLLSDHGCVTGVRALDRVPHSDEQALHADLVVAATGRAAKVPAWLESMGYERPAEERVQVDIMYASRHLRLRPGALGSDTIIFNGPKARRPRGMALFLEEDDRWLVTLHGYGVEHHPPTDSDAFNAFAATVADADVHAAIEEAEAIDEITTHAYPAGVRRRYERLRRFPDGFVVIGDAICSFNPIYGQGMTVATLQAEALARCLRQGDHHLARRYFKAASRPVEHAWKLSTGADLALPEVDAQAALPDRIVSRYLDRLLSVAEHDEHVSKAFLNVLGMLNSPTSLLHPTIALRVVGGSLPRRTASPRSRHSRPPTHPRAPAL
jgi:2-polyprenyl-6-methoxyphenol hydroxylase-like FAD-dependent oxidoreductase